MTAVGSAWCTYPTTRACTCVVHKALPSTGQILPAGCLAALVATWYLVCPLARTDILTAAHSVPSLMLVLHRFAAEGYRRPKPLINIVGRPMLFWLLDNLQVGPEDTVWIGMQQELQGAEYAIEARLRQEYPCLDLRVVSIDFQTRGAVETLFIMLQVYTRYKAIRLESTRKRRAEVISR